MHVTEATLIEAGKALMYREQELEDRKAELLAEVTLDLDVEELAAFQNSYDHYERRLTAVRNAQSELVGLLAELRS